MIPQKDYLVDRRKVEVQQCMEPKRTNRDIDFLRSLNLLPLLVVSLEKCIDWLLVFITTTSQFVLRCLSILYRPICI